MTTIHTKGGIFEVEENIHEIQTKLTDQIIELERRELQGQELQHAELFKRIELTLVPDPEATIGRENDVARFFVSNIVMFI